MVEKSLPEAFAHLARAARPETGEFLNALRRKREEQLFNLMGADVDKVIAVQGAVRELNYLINLFEGVLVSPKLA